MICKINSFTLVLTILFIGIGHGVNGQIGGLDTYQFLNLSPSARITALGGHTIAIRDQDVTLGLLNPAALSDTTHKVATINHNFHVAGISTGYAAYGHHWSDLRLSTSVGVQYVDYGDFVRADVFGNRDGQFSGSEVALVLGASRVIDDRLIIGANLKAVSSNLDTYGSLGVGVDLGAQYVIAESQMIWALTLRNIGGQISSDGPKREGMPLDLMIGVSKRLKYLPFRWMITAHDLQRWDLSYSSDVDNDPIIIGQALLVDDGPNVIDNFFRHLTFGGELLIGPREGLALRLGYDHQRKQELSVNGFRSLSGLSFGIGFKVKRFQIDYGVGRYHLGGGMNHLSLRMNLGAESL